MEEWMAGQEIVEAVAAALRGRWPERRVFVNEAPAGSQGSFYVDLEGAEQVRELGARRRRVYTVGVLLTTKAHDRMEYLAFSEAMFELFDELRVGGAVLYPQQMRAERADRALGFFMDIPVRLTCRAEGAPAMGRMDVKQAVEG